MGAAHEAGCLPANADLPGCASTAQGGGATGEQALVIIIITGPVILWIFNFTEAKCVQFYGLND